MATYTSNYNLYMPDPTDPVGDFRSKFNSNMQTIDQNLGGGGGGGGHTIVNPSGSDMPAEGKLQFTGGVTVTDDSANGKTVVDISGGGGGGNVYGAFIDTNRVIASGSYSSSYSYTATEDCYLFFTCGGTTSSSGKLYLEGNLIRYIFVNNSDNNYGDGIYLKKGQTAEVQSPQAGTFQYIVYGLTQGTESIFTPIIYSDTERVVGVWRDNKPLYAKTVGIGSLPNNATKVTAHGISDIDTICSIDGIAYDGSGKTIPLGYINVDSYTYDVQVEVGKVNVEIKTKIDFTSYTGYITVQYTKTTDVAGSGNWNTDGVPTHHYSTNEQVIGTWIDGKPLYERTINGGALSSGTHNIETLTVEEVKLIKGFVVDPNDASYMRPLPFSADSTNAIRVDVTNHVLRIITYSSWSGYSAYLTIQYTKSTD